MTATTPTLSVTLTNYNYGRFVADAIESVLAQNFTDFELIVIDNASTDDSLEVIGRYLEDPRIRLVAHEVNQGMFASLRQSVELCRGRYRVHVDADDWVLEPDAFETQVGFLERHPSVAFVYGSMTMMTTDGHEMLAVRPHDGDRVLPAERALESILSFTLNHSGLMFRLDAYRAGAGYGDGVAHVADMLLAARLCEHGDVAYLDRKLYVFGQHADNLHSRPKSGFPARRSRRSSRRRSVDRSAVGYPTPRRRCRRVLRRALVQLPTEYVFSGRLASGWRLYTESVRAHPLLTLGQPRTVALIIRTVLGGRRYEAGAARRSASVNQGVGQGRVVRAILEGSSTAVAVISQRTPGVAEVGGR